ncbi:MAG: hypothetical protein R3E10_15060 [Gemmatimonadota bacterium]
MASRIPTPVWVVTLIVVVVGMDVLLFKGRLHFWSRLVANVGIVLLFAAFYLRLSAKQP